MKTYIYISFLALFTFSILGGCKISKDVLIPTDAVPDAYRNASSLDSSSIASFSLHEFFDEAGLKGLIDSALVRNYDLQLAIKNIESAELLFRQSKLGSLPDLRLQVTANSTRPSDNSLNGLSAGQFLNTTHIEDFNANIGLNWEADIWGKVKNQKKAAIATYLQADEVKKAIQTRLIANVANGYYNLLMMDEQLAIATRNLALSDSTLRIIKLQFEAGQVTSLGIHQAEAQRLVAAQLIPRLEQNIAVQENALGILTGKLPGPISRLSTLGQTRVTKLLNPGIPSQMVSRRPDVKRAELALQIANARVGMSKASLYPTLNITAGAGLNALKASDWFNIPASLFGVAAGGITQPIFQRKQLKTQYELSKIEREKVVIEFRQSVLLAIADVSDELVKLEKLNEEYDIALRKVAALKNAVSNSNMLFKQGMATYLEVITAQSNTLQSELELSAIKTAQLSASVELYRALGGGIN